MYTIFLKNKYTSLYFRIIENSKNRSFDCYTENHHILPKSLGGSDDKFNLTKLTAREHFLCHYLLCKMLKPKSKEFYSMIKAFRIMKNESDSHNKNRYFNSKLYERFRKEFSIAMSLSQSGSGNSQYGTCWIHYFDKNLNEIAIKIMKNELQNYLLNGYFIGRSNKTKFKEIKIKPKTCPYCNLSISPIFDCSFQNHCKWCLYNPKSNENRINASKNATKINNIRWNNPT